MEITLKEFAEKHNKVRTRRGHKMSLSYIYRLIRQANEGTLTRNLWFNYEYRGEKDSIKIIIDENISS